MEAETTESVFTSFMNVCDVCKASKDEFQSREPKLLPCLHSFCRACVPETTDPTGAAVGLKCPTCSQECLPSDLIENHFANSSEGSGGENSASDDARCTGCEENVPATSYCIDCDEWLCDQCVQAHRRVRMTKDHTIQPKDSASQVSATSGAERASHCPIHRQEPLKLFCETCDKLTCRDCQLQEHKEHKYSFVNEASASYKLFLQTLLGKLKEKRTYIENAKSLINKRYDEISDKEKKVTNEIKVLAVKLITEINKRGKQLLTDLSAICGAKKTQLGHKQAEILSLSNKLDHALRFAEFMLQHSSSSSILHTKRTLVNQLRHVLRTRCEVPNPYHVVDIRLRNDENFIVNHLARQGQLVVDGVPYQGPHSLRQSMQPVVAPATINGNPPGHGSPRTGAGSGMAANLQNLAPDQRMALIKKLAQLHGSRNAAQAAAGMAVAGQGVNSPTSTMSSPRLPFISQQTPVSANTQRLSHYTPPAQSSTVSSSGNNQLGRSSLYFGNKHAPGSQGFINLHQLQKQRIQRLQQTQQLQQPVTSMQNPIVIAPTSPTSYGPPVFPSASGSPDGQRSSPHLVHTSPGSVGSHGGTSPIGLLSDPSGRLNSPVEVTPGAEHNISPYSRQSSTDSLKPSSSMKPETSGDRPSCSYAGINIKQEATSQQGGIKPLALVSGEFNFDDDPINFLENIKKEAQALQTDSGPDGIMNLSVGHENYPSSAESTHPDVPFNFYMQGQSIGSGASFDTSMDVDLAYGINQGVPESVTMSTSQDDPSEDYCACCHNGGDLLCCDTCPKVWHLQCHVPSLVTTPVGNWSCRLCKKDDAIRLDMPELHDEPPVSSSTKRKQPVGLSDRELMACERVLLELFCIDCSLPFHEPVSKSVPNYYKIVTHPMDFLTIKSKLSRSHFNHYETIEDFVADVKLVFHNCTLYNKPESEVGKIGGLVEKFFEGQMKRFIPFFDVKSVAPASETHEKHKSKRKKKNDDPDKKKIDDSDIKKKTDDLGKKKNDLEKKKYNFEKKKTDDVDKRKNSDSVKRKDDLEKKKDGDSEEESIDENMGKSNSSEDTGKNDSSDETERKRTTSKNEQKRRNSGEAAKDMTQNDPKRRPSSDAAKNMTEKNEQRRPSSDAAKNMTEKNEQRRPSSDAAKNMTENNLKRRSSSDSANSNMVSNPKRKLSSDDAKNKTDESVIYSGEKNDDSKSDPNENGKTSDNNDSDIEDKNSSPLDVW